MLSVAKRELNCDFIFFLPGVEGVNMLSAQLASVAAKASPSSLKTANGGNLERKNCLM